MNIPILNIYYLLCYAWDKLEEKDRVNISVSDSMELLDLCAKVLLKATRILLKRGIDKTYIGTTEEIPGIKGKIQLSQTLKSNILYKQRTICSFDEFSSNVLTNRILVSTLQILSRTKGLDKKLKEEVVAIRRMLPDIEPIEITTQLFKQIRLTRNTRFYGFVLNVCQIIHEYSLPSDEHGTYTFSDFTRDERKMNQLFEAFIRNFYRKEQQKFRVRREDIKWDFTATSDSDYNYLPLMKTDITLENDNSKIIIDAKYYKETMAVHYNREKIYSANLYQIFSYLINQEDERSKTLTATGVLLYPTIDAEYNLDYTHKGHNIHIRTINLNQSPVLIHNRLLSILRLG